jgi:hypothetical protein
MGTAAASSLLELAELLADEAAPMAAASSGECLRFRLEPPRSIGND